MSTGDSDAVSPGADDLQVPVLYPPRKLPESAPEVVIFTDGGCSPNPGPGGWAAILCTDRGEMELAGGREETTNNRMEMTAALQGLLALREPCRVTVVTDSNYLRQGMTEWIAGWSERGWRRKKSPILNPDLWKELARATLAHEAYWSWTKGHAGHELNERCDELAGRMIGKNHAPEDPVGHCERRERSTPPPKPENPAPTASFWLPPGARED